jgi:HEAT repeat protein
MNERWRSLAVAGHRGDAAAAGAALDDPDPVSRALALGALDRMGSLDDEHLVVALADPSADVRRRALELAARRPHLDLLDSLHDTDDTVVEVAAWACGEHESVPTATLDRLVQLATDATAPLVREAAVAALGAIGQPAGLSAILTACGDVPAVRRRAVLALAPFEGPEVDAALERALADRDWQVRQNAEDVSG